MRDTIRRLEVEEKKRNDASCCDENITSVSEIVVDIGRDTVKALVETALLFLGAKLLNDEYKEKEMLRVKRRNQ